MSATVYHQRLRPRKLSLIWLAPIQAASLLTIWAISAGGQVLRAWLLSALLWLLALPLLVSLETGLVAMMLFEPVRGLLRRAQYLFVDYAAQDPIHLLTPIVTLIGLTLLLRSQRLNILRATPLAGWVSLLALVYVVEIFNPLQGNLFVGLAGALFMLVPLAWFYFGQAVKEEFVTRALQLVIVLGLITSAYGIYQMLFGYPAFEQNWIDNTDFYNSIAVGHVKRALASFSSAEEWGRYVEIGSIAAIGFAAATKRLVVCAGWLLCGAALACMVLLTGQRTAVFGLILGVAVFVILGARNIRGVVARVAMLALPVLLVIVLVKPPTEDEMWSKGDNETVSTLLSHTKRGTLNPADEESLQARFESWAYLATRVIPYRPLGAGLGAGSLSEARFKQDSDLPPIDSFILVVAVACGIPGVLLFLWILSRATWLSLRVARVAPRGSPQAALTRTVAALMPALFLNSIFGLTFTLYSVAPIAWMLIGWISAEMLRARREAERETITI